MKKTIANTLTILSLIVIIYGFTTVITTDYPRIDSDTIYRVQEDTTNNTCGMIGFPEMPRL